MDSNYYQTLHANEVRKNKVLLEDIESIRKEKEKLDFDAQLHDREVNALEKQIALLIEEVQEAKSTTAKNDESLETVRQQRDDELMATDALQARVEAQAKAIKAGANCIYHAQQSIGGIRNGENINPTDVWSALESLDSATKVLKTVE
jgi:chromosome segregation ATPase